jgi:DNA-binding transcriptional MocR family regulator
LRLSFATPTPQQIDTGISRIARALDRLGAS